MQDRIRYVLPVRIRNVLVELEKVAERPLRLAQGGRGAVRFGEHCGHCVCWRRCDIDSSMTSLPQLNSRIREITVAKHYADIDGRDHNDNREKLNESSQ